MDKIKNNFRSLYFTKQGKENRSISLRAVASETGLAINTVMKWSKETGVDRFDSDTVAKLCRYFDCGVGDLLEYIPGDEHD